MASASPAQQAAAVPSTSPEFTDVPDMATPKKTAAAKAALEYAAKSVLHGSYQDPASNLVEYQKGIYQVLCSWPNSPFIPHAQPFSAQTDLALLLFYLARNSIAKIEEVKKNKSDLTVRRSQLKLTIEQTESTISTDELKHKRKYDKTDLKNLEMFYKLIEDKTAELERPLFLRGIYATQKAHHQLSEEKLSELKRAVDAKVETLEGMVKAYKEHTEKLRIANGVTVAIWDAFQAVKAGHQKVVEDAKEECKTLDRDIKILDVNIDVLEKDIKRTIKGAVFAEMLIVLRGPFNFMGLPREVRDFIYGYILTFPDKTTITSIIPGHSRRRRHNRALTPVLPKHLEKHPNLLTIEKVQLYHHPLFVSNSQIRQESMDWFYKNNEFGLFRKHQFDIELCAELMPKFCLESIRTLSISFGSITYSSKVFCSKIHKLTGLKTLNIYLNWQKVLASPKLDRLAVDAFELLVLHHVSVPATMTCYMIGKQLENHLHCVNHFREVKEELDNLSEKSLDSRFAVMMHIFQRRKMRENAETQVKNIRKMIDAAHEELRVFEEEAKEGNKQEDEDVEMGDSAEEEETESQESKKRDRDDADMDTDDKPAKKQKLFDAPQVLQHDNSSPDSLSPSLLNIPRPSKKRTRDDSETDADASTTPDAKKQKLSEENEEDIIAAPRPADYPKQLIPPEPVEEVKYPIPYTILSKDESYETGPFHHLSPNLTINIYTCPLTQPEVRNLRAKKDNQVFQRRVLDLRDPVVVEEEMVEKNFYDEMNDDGRGELGANRFGRLSVMAEDGEMRLMMREDLEEKIGEVFGKVEEREGELRFPEVDPS